MHQSIETPPLGSRGRVGDLTLTLVEGHQYPYGVKLLPPEAEVQIKHPSGVRKGRNFNARYFVGLKFQACVFFGGCNMKLCRTPRSCILRAPPGIIPNPSPGPKGWGFQLTSALA